MKNNSWTSELETGISAVDLDNHSLLDLINRVVLASDGADATGLKSSLLALQVETIVRFEREEQLMRECQYEAAAQHQAEHQQLSAEIQHQIKDLEAGQGNAAFIARFMRDWLLQHIVSKDVLFGQAVLTQQGTTDRRHENGDTHSAGHEIDVFEERRLANLQPIAWTSKIAVGIETIDAGHRSMIALYNDILVASKSGDKTKLATLLEQLGNATAAHFQSEEQLMSGFHYELAATHTGQHRRLLDEFAHQVDDWRKNHISAALLCRFMHSWLLRHIAASDLPLAKAIHQQGSGRPA